VQGSIGDTIVPMPTFFRYLGGEADEPLAHFGFEPTLARL
jgi:hypothetical protein